MNTTKLYDQRASAWSDIQAHMPLLRELATQCTHITEFGVRDGNSTVAFLAGLPTDGRLVSYDRNPGCVRFDDRRWTFYVADTAEIDTIAPTDLLFLDTLHDAFQVALELQHADNVRSYLVFHDVVLFGCADETTGEPPGIMHAILSFMACHPEWRVLSYSYESCGLLVLERR